MFLPSFLEVLDLFFGPEVSNRTYCDSKKVKMLLLQANHLQLPLTAIDSSQYSVVIGNAIQFLA